MNLPNNDFQFSTLLSPIKSDALRQHLEQLSVYTNDISTDASITIKQNLSLWKQQWFMLSTERDEFVADDNNEGLALLEDSEKTSTNWLIRLFNTLFSDKHVILARSNGEPEYFPAVGHEPARIEFAHGYFASALHEISHWCVAGDARRELPDFGYWYAPDGRSAAQQQAFERVEIKPQALECLFTLACGRHFRVSQDNLSADFDTSGSTFALDVYNQVENYIAKPHTLPRDAKTLLHTLLSVCATG